MINAEKDILTTADTAKLLGVSVRTAQLLIEGGTIPSWKTPGGHRRVYRADVMALIESGGRSAPAPTSSTVVIIAAAVRLAQYRELAGQMPECTAEMFDDILAALVSIGAMKPHAIIVDLEDAVAELKPLIESLAENPALAQSRLLAVGRPSALSWELPARVMRVASPGEAMAALRKWIGGDEEPILEQDGLPYPIALNERQRLVALERTGLLDSPPEEAFDRLTWLAAQSLDTPIALMTLLTPTRQWFKSRIGLDLPETPRSWAFCNHTILQRQVFSVPDLSRDSRFADNPAVRGEPGFRFYAGAPVHDDEGFVVGSLCVIDQKPRTLDEREARTIEALAALASDEVRLRKMDRKLREMQRAKDRARP
ncbi:excisionase family DNA-binding protein [Ancylobacter sp. VKM B-3255]|uniref:Excisionase family DNA-binding protein n=2 Tax=Ancylobacter radicis TaxID=2836179 RepID=A0ABS5RBH4_9HYPH|nr:excisionase family DNA-binding protein [Ancylobacter radicis]